MFKGWFAEYAELTSIPKNARPSVEEACVSQLRKVSADSETGSSELGVSND
jgi:hypothetical protein